MTIQVVREPYEVLIRWTGGVATGAHWRELETVRDGATVYAVNVLDPVPLALGGAEMSAVLGQVSAGLAAQILALEIEVANLKAQLPTVMRSDEPAA